MDAIKPASLAEAAAASETETSESSEVGLLVERAKGGDPGAFDELMQMYEHRVIALGIQMGLTREDALDACQDAFIKVFRYIRRFRSGESFFRWLYRIALNAIHDHRRRQMPSGMVSLDDLEPGQAAIYAESREPLADSVESADLARRLMAELSCLTERERTVLILRDLQEVPSVDVGRILGVSQVTVRRHCMSARLKLRDRLFPAADERSAARTGR